MDNQRMDTYKQPEVRPGTPIGRELDEQTHLITQLDDRVDGLYSRLENVLGPEDPEPGDEIAQVTPVSSPITNTLRTNNQRLELNLLRLQRLLGRIEL